MNFIYMIIVFLFHAQSYKLSATWTNFPPHSHTLLYIHARKREFLIFPRVRCIAVPQQWKPAVAMLKKTGCGALAAVLNRHYGVLNHANLKKTAFF